MRKIAPAGLGMIAAAMLVIAGCGGGSSTSGDDNDPSYKKGFDVGQGIEAGLKNPDPEQVCNTYEIEWAGMGPTKIDKTAFVRGCLDGWKKNPHYSSTP